MHVGGVFGILSTLSWIIMKRICDEESLNLCLCNERYFKDNRSVALTVSVRRVLQSTMATRTRAHPHFNEEIFTLIECCWEPDINDSWITVFVLYTLWLTFWKLALPKETMVGKRVIIPKIPVIQYILHPLMTICIVAGQATITNDKWSWQWQISNKMKLRVYCIWLMPWATI